MAKGLIGQNFTFQVLFTDPATGLPLAVNTPTIEIYRWDEDGVKETLLAITALPASVPPETGRYAYTYLIPGSLTERDVIYALLKGLDPVSGDTLSVERIVSLYTQESQPSASTGLISRFVQGG